MKKIVTLLSFLCLLLTSNSVFASQIKVFVSDFNVVGLKEKDEIKQILKAMLISRLDINDTTVVGSEAEAQAVVNGVYLNIGKIFSIDVIARDRAGKIIARSIVQGDGEDDLIPAMKSLTDIFSAELQKAGLEKSPDNGINNTVPLSTK